MGGQLRSIAPLLGTGETAMPRKTQMNRLAVAATALLCFSMLYGCGALAALLESCLPGGGESSPLVCMQITETSDPVAFDRVMSELEARGIRCTVLVDDSFVTQNCQRIRELADDGFEIMAFARPEAPEGESVTMPMLSYQQQEALITGVKTAIEDCLGRTITGFCCYRFAQNEDTYAIVDALGFQFNLGFVAHTDCSLPGHQDDTLPYQGSGYDFWAVPMHSVYVVNRWAAFCDMPFRSLEAGQWKALLTSELDAMTAQGQPLLVEFHPYYTGADEGRFEAFVNFLDYAVGLNARFMTVAELVE